MSLPRARSPIMQCLHPTPTLHTPPTLLSMAGEATGGRALATRTGSGAEAIEQSRCESTKTAHKEHRDLQGKDGADSQGRAARTRKKRQDFVEATGSSTTPGTPGGQTRPPPEAEESRARARC